MTTVTMAKTNGAGQAHHRQGVASAAQQRSSSCPRGKSMQAGARHSNWSLTRRPLSYLRRTRQAAVHTGALAAVQLVVKALRQMPPQRRSLPLVVMAQKVAGWEAPLALPALQQAPLLLLGPKLLLQKLLQAMWGLVVQGPLQVERRMMQQGRLRMPP